MSGNASATLRGFDSLHDSFRAARVAEDERWRPGQAPPYIVVGGYAHAFSERVGDWTPAQRRTLFEFVEELLNHPDGEVRDLAATGFLEGLQHLDSAGEFDFREVATLLGPESLAFCLAYDKFTGATTRGLSGRER